MTSAFVRPESSATFGPVSEPVVVVPAYDVTDYSYDFSAGLGGWAAVSPAFLSTLGSGRAYLEVYSTSSAIRMQRTFTGLTIGHSYTLTATVEEWVAVAGTAWAAVSGGTAGTPVTYGSLATVTHTFTATATSHVLQFWADGSRTGTTEALWDNVELIHHVPAVTTLTPTLPISEGAITFADDWTPYVQATLDVPMEDVALLEQIDPRDNQRVTVTATDAIGGTTLTADLGLRSRTVNHKDGKITVELASDEALLMDRCNVSTTSDATPRTYESSLRNIVGWALGKIGATLEPGTANADLTARWDAHNLFMDPGTAATAPGGYTPGNCTLDTNDTSWSISGDGDSFNLYSPTNADSYLSLGSATGTKMPGLQEGNWYVLSATGNVKQAMSGTQVTSDIDAGTGTSLPRSRALVVHVRVGTGNYVMWHSPQVPNTVGAATRVAVKFFVPAGTTEAFLRAYLGYTSGQIRWDGFRLDKLGPGTLADNSVYFDGDTTDTADYIYSWDGDQDASQSTRTAVVERLPELFTWNPGQSLWEFLEPLLESAGLRLFCDEQRKWWLVDPTTYEADGYVVIQSGHNAIDGDDTISRNDETWADAVVCRFTNTDANGLTTTTYDVAGDPTGKCITYEFDGPFIPGRAARRLAVLQGRGRTQEVTALTKYTARPGQDVTINLPGTLTQTGKLREVIFDLYQGTAEYGTRGLTDVYPGAWATWDPEETWSEVDPALNWSDL